MKKTLKFALMLLISLPFVTLTSCEEDNEEALFTDYSTLLGKTRQGTIDYMGTQPMDDDTEYQYFYVNEGNVEDIIVYYSFFDGVVRDKAVAVDAYLTNNMSVTAVTNYLNSIYKYQGMEEDEDGAYYVYQTKNGKTEITYYVEDNDVMYLDLSALNKSKAEDVDMKAIRKALKANHVK